MTIYLSILIAVGVVTWIIVQAILANIWLLLIPAFPAIITVAWFVYNWAAVVRERRLLIRAQRLQSEHVIRTDDFGMLHYINLATNHSQNLTLDARTYRNGHYEPPTPQEAETHRYLLTSRHIRSARNTEQLLLPEPAIDLMTELRTAQRVLIKAASNGGKTTLLQHIAAQRVATESVLILDSQSYPDKWPAGCKVVGAGSNHQAISTALDGLIDLMVKRYQEIGQGIVREGQHPKLTIVIDEWMAIVGECDNASDVIRRLLTESRKAAFSVFIGSHSERVKALGLDGRGDLRDGFLIVRIELENGQRMATLATGRGERPCILPGEYVNPVSGNVVEIEAIETAQPTAEERRVLDMLENGESLRTITQAIWGQRGSFYNAKVEAIAKKYGREVRSEARNH